jgi:2-polyprenyl-3-methyl-5-hydroxy-6-metoxy-1,4-benzoquinol methylase
LYWDKENDLLVTLPRPSTQELPGYYDSDDYISHTDSKESVMDRIYQIIKNYSISKKLSMINGIVPEKGLILDIGCGTGDFLKACRKDGWRVCGIEPNDKARGLTAKKIDKEELVSDKIDSLLQTHGGKFDVITMWHVLEHVPNLLEYIEQVKLLLKPEGSLIVAVPNFKSYDAKHYKEYWAAYDVPRHLWHFSENAIRNIFEKYNFKVVTTLPLLFDSFYVSLLSEKHKTGKTNLLSAIKIGLYSNLKAMRSKQYSSLIYLIKNKN